MGMTAWRLLVSWHLGTLSSSVGRDIVGDFDPARAHRFSEDQLAYHYTKNYDLLRQ